MSKVTNVLLVHGAWADGSSWSKVIPPVVAAGLHVIAVQLPLSSFDDDVAALKRAMRSVEGAILLVGHSYGGVVITEAGLDSRVSGLVYIAAFAPDAGESLSSLRSAGTPAPLSAHILPDAGGFLKVTREGVSDILAQDLSDDEKATIHAVQKPTSKSCLGGTVTHPAWKAKPCWFVVTAIDRSFAPELQKAMAAKMDAKTVEVASGHMAMLSQPELIANTIIEAAAA